MKTLKHYIPLFHPLGQAGKTRIDFDSDWPEEEVLKLLCLPEYKLYQYIAKDHLYVMQPDELELLGIPHTVFSYQKIKTNWLLGSRTKTYQELLILPHQDFFYPYQFGNYVYLYSKNNYSAQEVNGWINQQFPDRDFDSTFAGFDYLSLGLLSADDYLIVTQHDYQKEFGISAQPALCLRLMEVFKEQNFANFSIEEYIQKM